MRSETNLLPDHSCASTAAKSTQATRSGCFCDPLVSAHRNLEPTECNLRNFLCIVVGNMERGAIGRRHGLRKVTMVCMDIFSVVQPLTRSTGRIQSTAGEIVVLSSSKATGKRQEIRIIPNTTLMSPLQSIDVSGCSPMLPHGFQFRVLSTLTLFIPLSAAIIHECSSR